MSTETETRSWLDRAIDKESRRRASSQADWDRLLPILRAMADAGIEPLFHRLNSGGYPTVKVRAGDLQGIRMLFGQMTVRQRIATDEKSVLVSVVCERAKGIDFDYQTELDPNDQCKIKIDPNPYRSYTLVCPTNNSPA